MSPARTNLAPDLPTFREQGYNVELSSLRGMAAPRGLPADIRERLVRAVGTICGRSRVPGGDEGEYTPLRYLTPASSKA